MQQSTIRSGIKALILNEAVKVDGTRRTILQVFILTHGVVWSLCVDVVVELHEELCVVFILVRWL